MQLLDSDIKTREVLDWKGVHLIHFQGSSCSQKARIFLNLKDIGWTSHHLNLAAQKNYDPWFLGINPRGLVPVLVHDGAVHIESNDILAYLNQSFPEPRLIPPVQHDAQISALREEDDLHMDIRTLTMRFVFPKFLAQKKPAGLKFFEESDGSISGEPDPHKAVELEFWASYAKQGITDQQAREAAKNFKRMYDGFELQLQNTRYLTGTDITLLDIAWFIYTHRLLSAGYPFARLHPAVYTWFTGLAGRPEFSKEVASAAPLKVVTAVLHMVQALKGTKLEQVAEL
jgi:ganglioside-induced differentiation-associated protein 1